MSTLAPGGRITIGEVKEEIRRLEQQWQPLDLAADKQPGLIRDILGETAAVQLDLFDRLQLQGVLKICCQCHSLSEAGRRLYQVSRQQKRQTNDADRLRNNLFQ